MGILIPVAGAVKSAVPQDAWKGTLEEAMSRVVRPLPEGQLKGPLECSVCLRHLISLPNAWVVFPCKHGVCAQCFQSLLDAQVSTTPPLRCTNTLGSAPRSPRWIRRSRTAYFLAMRNCDNACSGTVQVTMMP